MGYHMGIDMEILRDVHCDSRYLVHNQYVK